MEKYDALIRIREEIERLLEYADSCIVDKISCADMERNLLKGLLKQGLLISTYIIEQKSELFSDRQPSVKNGGKFVKKGKTRRKYLSIFGMLEFSRMCWWSKECGKQYPLDEEMELPVGHQWSYLLRELCGESASDQDFRASVHTVNKLLGLGLSWKASSRNAELTGSSVDAYYEQKEKQSEEEEGEYFCMSVDGKGVPMVPRERPSKPKAGKRQGKGEKSGVKKEATVVVVSSFTPKTRTGEDIICGLMGSPLTKLEGSEEERDRENDNRWHKGIHCRAFLSKQKEAIEYGILNMKERMNKNSRFVVPVDAGVGLEPAILKSISKHGLDAQFSGIILDVVHVCEYVWDVATPVFGEKSNLRQRWVGRVMQDILNSDTDKVLNDFIAIRDKTKVSKTAKKQLNRAIKYFSNHQHKMDYKSYIEQGFPVSSALVEAKCGHLVKDRMEQSGMRWTSQGAQAILDLRAVKINSDMEDFMRFVPKNERRSKLHKAA